MKPYKRHAWYIGAILLFTIIGIVSLLKGNNDGAGWAALTILIIVVPALMLAWLADCIIDRKIAVAKKFADKPTAVDPSFGRKRAIVISIFVIVLIAYFIAK